MYDINDIPKPLFKIRGLEFYFEFYNQWVVQSLLTKNLNWFDFTIITASVERTYYANTTTVTLGLLGINLYLSLKSSNPPPPSSSTSS